MFRLSGGIGHQLFSFKMKSVYLFTLCCGIIKGDAMNLRRAYRNGSLFTYLTATVTVNGLENEMSSELRFQGRKWGVASRVHPRDPEGVERGYPCLRPPIFDREIDNLREYFIL